MATVSRGRVELLATDVSPTKGRRIKARAEQELPGSTRVIVSPRVQLVPEAPAKAAISPTDLVSEQWALPLLGVTADTRALASGSGVKVAVVDTGVAQHEDLEVADSIDLTGEDTDGRVDPYGHGTHVAGIIGASYDNALGVDGVETAPTLQSVRVLDETGSGSYAAVAAGVTWAVDSDARVINLSLGGYYYSYELREAITYARSRGAVVVGAAGNEERTRPFFPAAFPGVLGVSATTRTDALSWFSNHGFSVDVAAPGSGIVSTYPGSNGQSYAYLSGTSMAAPHASGLAAALLAAHPSWTERMVRNQIMASAKDLGERGFDSDFAYGRINFARAVQSGELPPVGPRQYAKFWAKLEMPDAAKSGREIVVMVRANRFNAYLRCATTDSVVLARKVPTYAEVPLDMPRTRLTCKVIRDGRTKAIGRTQPSG